MINIVIVDDIDIKTIKNEVILFEDSILKDKCFINEYQFAHCIPEEYQDYYSEKDTAVVGIAKDANTINYDVAFLDFEFPNEILDGNKIYEPLLAVVRIIEEHHPNCQIIITSQNQTMRHPIKKYNSDNLNFPDDEQRIFISISKATGRLTDEQKNDAFKYVFTNRLIKILNGFSWEERKIVKGFLLDKTEGFIIKVDKIEYNQNNLLFHYYEKSNSIDKENVFYSLFDSLNNIPKFSNKIWTEEGSYTIDKKTKEKKYERRYPLKDYYFQYQTFYSDIEPFKLEVIINNAKEALISVAQFVNDISEDTETALIWSGYPSNKYRNLKFNLKKQPNGKIPDADMSKFMDFLSHRLLFIGLYYGLNLSSNGINYLLDKNSHSNSPQRAKKFSTYLRLGIKDQLSTETDLKIELLRGINEYNPHGFTVGDNSLNKQRLKVLKATERNYDGLFQSLATYEKDFVKDICDMVTGMTTITTQKEHVNYILSNVNFWDNQ